MKLLAAAIFAIVSLALVAGASAQQPVYAYYYLWWSTAHWQDRLGPNYAYGQSPLPLPASLGADGCGAVSLYQGNSLVDVPVGLVTQDDPATIEADVRTAAAHGITGFLVSWIGTGSPTQTSASSSYHRRLASLVDAVHRVNAEGIPFRLWLGYGASASLPSTAQIAADLEYLRATYGADPALDRRGGRPVLVWIGSRKYPLTSVQAVSSQFRPSFFLVGDENWKTWGDGRAAYLDGDQYYWSSQDPYANPASFDQVATLAQMVRASGPNPDLSPKLWFAPITPGYNAELLSGSGCVPRASGDTMRRLYAGNARSAPDGWVLISWNELAEGTYVQPLQRYGSTYVDLLRSLVGEGVQADAPPTSPTSLRASPLGSTAAVDLSWTASTDDVGVTGYDVYRNGLLVASTPGTTFYRDGTVGPSTTYEYRVRARDGSGNTSAFSASASVTTAPIVFADGFETGNLGRWTVASGLAVQSQQVWGGLFAARATTTGAVAYAWSQLSTARMEVYARLRFKVLGQSSGSLDLFKLRTTNGSVLITLYRTQSGKLSYRNAVAGINTYSTTQVSAGVWHDVELHVRVAGSASLTEVWLDGVTIADLGKPQQLGTAPISRVQIGVDSSGRGFDAVFDDVAVGAARLGP